MLQSKNALVLHKVKRSNKTNLKNHELHGKGLFGQDKIDARKLTSSFSEETARNSEGDYQEKKGGQNLVKIQKVKQSDKKRLTNRKRIRMKQWRNNLKEHESTTKLYMRHQRPKPNSQKKVASPYKGIETLKNLLGRGYNYVVVRNSGMHFDLLNNDDRKLDNKNNFENFQEFDHNDTSTNESFFTYESNNHYTKAPFNPHQSDTTTVTLKDANKMLSSEEISSRNSSSKIYHHETEQKHLELLMRTTEQSLFKQLKESLSPNKVIFSGTEGMDILTRNENYFMLMDAPSAFYITSNTPCSFVSESLRFVSYHYAFVLGPHLSNDFINKINLSILEMKHNGFIDNTYHKWWVDKCNMKGRKGRKNKFKKKIGRNRFYNDKRKNNYKNKKLKMEKKKKKLVNKINKNIRLEGRLKQRQSNKTNTTFNRRYNNQNTDIYPFTRKSVRSQTLDFELKQLKDFTMKREMYKYDTNYTCLYYPILYRFSLIFACLLYIV